MGADPQRYRGMPAGNPLRQPPLMRHQPGVGAGPGQLQFGLLAVRQIPQQEVELLDISGDQDQALFHRPLLELQQALHRRAVEGVTTQPPYRFGGIGDDAPGIHYSSQLP